MSRPRTTAVQQDKRSKPAGLESHEQGRTERVVRRLEKAMAAIRAEIELADRIYPENKGRLTQAEVCRRAGLKKGVLQGPCHKTTTKLTVDTFVTEMTSFMAGQGKSAKRIITTRADEWKEAHKKIAQAYHIDHLRLEDALKQIKVLEAENEILREKLNRLSDSNIRNLPARKPQRSD